MDIQEGDFAGKGEVDLRRSLARISISRASPRLGVSAAKRTWTSVPGITSFKVVGVCPLLTTRSIIHGKAYRERS